MSSEQGPDLRDVASAELDTSNRFLISVAAGPAGERFAMYLPPLQGQVLTREEMLVLAAWAVALADPEFLRFPMILERVRNA